MKLQQLMKYYEQNQFDQGLNEILAVLGKLKDKGKLLKIKNILHSLQDEYSYYTIIRLLDYGLLYKHSSFLARRAYKTFPTLWTFSWNIDDYIMNGQALEAQEFFKQKIKKGDLERYPADIQEKILFSYVQVLLELNKSEEAEKILNDCKQEVFYKWGYYYLEIGNRQRAREEFRKGCQGSRNDYKCYLMLAMIENMEGHPEEALSVIEEGETFFPNMPIFTLEKISCYSELNQDERMMESIYSFEQRIPFSVYSSYLKQKKADYYYQQQDFDKLNELLQDPALEKSPYQKRLDEGNHKKLAVHPIIQKSNYCVPACLQMLTRYHGEERHQDEIAQSIFQDVGSTMPHTIAYWESVGFTCRYVCADLKVIKACIERDLPILLCVDIELASHVQIITGYDDRIGVLYIQDPNTKDTLMVSYEDYEKTYYMTSYLSIVAVKQERKEQLDFLPSDDDTYFRRLYHYSALLDQDVKAHLSEMVAFLRENKHHRHTNLFIIKHLHEAETKALFEQVVQALDDETVKNDTIYLHIADGFIRYEDFEQAEYMVERVEAKYHNGFYHFLKGRMAYERDCYDEAIFHFKLSLKQDDEHFVTWSYLAMCYSFRGDFEAALEASSIAYSSFPGDLFIVMNHCKVLMDQHLYQEALQVLKQESEQFGNQAAYVYALGQVYSHLDEVEESMSCFEQVMLLDAENYKAYAALSDLFVHEKEDFPKAEQILRTGIEKVNEKQELYCRLGDLYFLQERYEQALRLFEKCMEEYPDYSFAYVKYSDSLRANEQMQEAKAFLVDRQSQFQDDVEFLINGGMSLLYHGDVHEGLDLLEKGISLIHYNWEEPMNEYVQAIEEHALFERGIAYLTREIAKKSELTFAFLTYKAILLHKCQNSSWKAIFDEALQLNEQVFTHAQLAEALFEEEEYEEAKVHFLYCLEHNSQNIHYLFRLAEMANANEESQEEIAYLKQIFEVDYKQLDSSYFFSIIEKEEAEQYIQRIEADEDGLQNPTTINFLAYAYGAIGDSQKEKELVLRALQMDEDDVDIVGHQIQVDMAQGRWKQAQMSVLSAIKKHGFHEPFFSQFAEVQYQLGKYVKSYDIIKKLDLTAEEKAMAYTICGDYIQNELMNTEEEANDMALLKKIVKKVSRSSSKFMKTTACIMYYEQAIASNPAFIPAYIGIAHLYERDGLPEEAVKVLTKCLEHQESYELMYDVAVLHLQVAQEALHEEKHVSRAIAVLEEMRLNYPQRIDGVLLLAQVYSDYNQFEEAEDLVDEWLQREPENAVLCLLKGTLLNQQEKYDEGREILLQGLSYEQENAEIQTQLLRAYVGLNEPVRAINLYQDFEKREWDVTEAKYYAASAYSLLGQNERARRLLEEVFEEDAYYEELASKDKTLEKFQ